MFSRIKRTGWACVEALKDLLFKLFTGLLYLVRLKKRSPFDEALNQREDGQMMSSKEKKLENYNQKLKFFKTLIVLFWGICVVGIIYSNVIKKKGIIDQETQEKIQVFEEIFSKSKN